MPITINATEFMNGNLDFCILNIDLVCFDIRKVLLCNALKICLMGKDL